MLVLPDGNTTIIIQGSKRFRVEKYLKENPYLTAKIQVKEDNFPNKNKKEVKKKIQSMCLAQMLSKV